MDLHASTGNEGLPSFPKRMIWLDAEKAICTGALNVTFRFLAVPVQTAFLGQTIIIAPHHSLGASVDRDQRTLRVFGRKKRVRGHFSRAR